VDPAPTRQPPARMTRPRRDEVRRRLLRAALAVFTEQGYERSSLDQVAAAAGFSKGAVYSNFASKDELFLALMDQQVRDRIDRVRAALDELAGEGVSAQLAGDRLTAALTDDRDWQLLFLDYVGRAVRDPRMRERLATHRRQLRQLIADTMQDYTTRQDTHSGLDPDAQALTLLALSNGIAIERFIDPDTVPDALLGQILQLLKSGSPTQPPP